MPNVTDPLGGSYYLEALTDQLESEAEALFGEIEKIGGVVRGIEMGWFQRQIAMSAMRAQHEVEQHRHVVVGVNEFVIENEAITIPLLRIGAEAEQEQVERMRKLRTRRDKDLVQRCLDALTEVTRANQNVIPAMLDCARAYATLYEIREAMEKVYGAYKEPVFF